MKKQVILGSLDKDSVIHCDNVKSLLLLEEVCVGFIEIESEEKFLIVCRNRTKVGHINDNFGYGETSIKAIDSDKFRFFAFDYVTEASDWLLDRK